MLQKRCFSACNSLRRIVIFNVVVKPTIIGFEPRLLAPRSSPSQAVCSSRIVFCARLVFTWHCAAAGVARQSVIVLLLPWMAGPGTIGVGGCGDRLSSPGPKLLWAGEDHPRQDH
jgi:hypothetical protein